MKIQEAEQTTYLGILALKAPPTNEYRAAIWENMLGTVYAMNDEGKVEYFDYKHKEAMEFARVNEPGAMPRVYRISRGAYGKPYGEFQGGPGHGKLVLFIKKSQYRDAQLADINSAPESKQIEFVKWDRRAIGKIKNPSVKVQMAAVKKFPHAIMHIADPAENVQLHAVNEYGDILQYILKNGITPSLDVQLAALRKYPYGIGYILNAELTIDPQVKRLVLQTLIDKIKNEDFEGAGDLFGELHDRVQWPEMKTIEKILKEKNVLYENTKESNIEAEDIATVSKYPLEIRNIKNPSEAVQLAAVQRSGEVIKYVVNPTEAVKLAAVKEFGYAIKYINDPSEQVQLEAVKNWPFAIAEIDANIVAPKVKRYILMNMLDTIKSGNVLRVERLNNILRQKGYNWPELDTLERHSTGKNPVVENKLDLASEQEHLAAVKKNVQIVTDLIKSGASPSDAVQLQAAKQWGPIIKHFKNPSDAVRLAAVENDPLAIQYIPKTKITLDIKRTILKHLLQWIRASNTTMSHWRIRNLYLLLRKKVSWPELDSIEKALKNKNILRESTDPFYTEEFQLHEVTTSADAIFWIMNAGIEPSEKVKLTSVQSWPSSIRHIENPSRDIQVNAVYRMPSAIKYIKNPVEDAIILSLKDNFMNIEYVNTEITPPVKKLILKKIVEMINAKNYHYGLEIYHILKNKNFDWPELQTIERNLKAKKLLEITDNDSEQVQIAMVNKNWENILDLKNPSEAVQMAAVKRWPEGIKYIIDRGIIPSVDVQLTALEEYPVSAFYIRKDVFAHHDPKIKRLLLKKLLEYINEERGKGWYLGLQSVNLFKILQDKQVNWPELQTIQKYFDENNLL